MPFLLNSLPPCISQFASAFAALPACVRPPGLHAFCVCRSNRPCYYCYLCSNLDQVQSPAPANRPSSCGGGGGGAGQGLFLDAAGGAVQQSQRIDQHGVRLLPSTKAFQATKPRCHRATERRCLSSASLSHCIWQQLRSRWAKRRPAQAQGSEGGSAGGLGTAAHGPASRLARPE